MDTKRKEFNFADFLENPELLKEATKQELVKAYMQISEYSKDVEGAKKEINVELWNKLEANSDLIKDADGKRYMATKIKMSKFSTKVEEAEKLGAVKTKTVIDTEKLKTLVLSGIEVPGHNVAQYVLVKEVVEKTEEGKK